MSIYLPRLLGMAVLLLLSGFFSGSETALFSLTKEDRDRLARSAGKAARAAAVLLADHRSLLITILFGNMMVNVATYALGAGLALHVAAAADPHYRPFLKIVFGVASLCSVIIIGEVTPKILAVSRARSLALAVSLPILALRIALSPIVFVLGSVVSLINAVTRRRMADEPRITEEELSMLLDMSAQSGVITRAEKDMIDAVVELSDLRVKEIMVHRVDAVMFNAARPVAELHRIIQRTGRTRIPVYRGSRDNIIGVADARRLLLADPAPQSLDEVMRPPQFVPEVARLESVLRQFRDTDNHIAIVVDEYGGFSGIVTLEDVLAEVVGPVAEEVGETADAVVEVAPRTYRLDGALSIRDWNELFRMNLDIPELDTLGGFVTLLLGHVPHEGDRASFANLRFTVEKVERRRIRRLLLEIGEGAPPSPPQEH